MTTISVTADDILEGLPANVRHCPVATAISRVVGGPVVVDFDDPMHDQAHVELGEIRHSPRDAGRCIPLPKAVARWISNYDDGMLGRSGDELAGPEPFTFELDLPELDVVPIGRPGGALAAEEASS